MTNKYNFLSYVHIQVAEEIKNKIYYIIFNILHLLREYLMKAIST